MGNASALELAIECLVCQLDLWGLVSASQLTFSYTLHGNKFSSRGFLPWVGSCSDEDPMCMEPPSEPLSSNDLVNETLPFDDETEIRCGAALRRYIPGSGWCHGTVQSRVLKSGANLFRATFQSSTGSSDEPVEAVLSMNETRLCFMHENLL